LFAVLVETIVPEEEGNLEVVDDGLVGTDDREVGEVGTTAACSPKVYHLAVSPTPAVFVVYTVCRMAPPVVQPNPENGRLPAHILVAQESNPGSVLPAIRQWDSGVDLNLPLRNQRIALTVAVTGCGGSNTRRRKRYIGTLSARATLVDTVECVDSTSLAGIANIRRHCI
jgi:hypothetical protein